MSSAAANPGSDPSALTRGGALCFGVLAAALGASPAVAAQDDCGKRILCGPDGTYRNRATYELIELARARHRTQQSAIRGYRATLFTRMEGRIGSSRFGGGVPLMKHETAARIQWHQPGDMTVDLLGSRSTALRLPGLRRERWAAWWAEVMADEPWFSPAALGDDIEFMGMPDEEAIHPLAPHADRFYRYAIVDSMTMTLPGRTVRAVAVQVTPRDYRPIIEEDVRRTERPAAEVSEIMAAALARLQLDDPERAAAARARLDSVWSPPDRDVRVVRRVGGGVRHRTPTLVSGQMWLDADGFDVVRFMVTFVGEGLWEDEPESPVLVAFEADLEYGLHHNRFWLPHRQIFAATFTYRYLPGATLPAIATTTFADYVIDADTGIAFATALPSGVTGRRFGGRWRCPEPWEWDWSGPPECGADSFIKTGHFRNGGRWEVRVPPLDSLQRFAFDDDFEPLMELADADVVRARIGSMASLTEALPDDVVGRSPWTIDWAHVYGAFRFNRVQGPSLGFGTTWRTGIDFTTLHVNGRFGFGDRRPLGSFTWRRDGPGGRFELSVARAVEDVEPWTNGLTLGSSMKALVAGHDDADYYLSLGGGVAFQGYGGPLGNGTVTLRFERQRSMTAASGSAINDVFFGSGRLPPNPDIADGDFVRSGVTRPFTVGATMWTVGVDGLVGRDVTGGDRGVVRLWGSGMVPIERTPWLAVIRVRGGTQAGDALPQMQYRAGGPGTVRGYDYGVRTGSTFWSAQLDLERVVSQWWSPVIFMDAGNAGRGGDPMLGAGVGVSLLSGWMRVDLAKGLHPRRAVRADLLFQMPIN